MEPCYMSMCPSDAQHLFVLGVRNVSNPTSNRSVEWLLGLFEELPLASFTTWAKLTSIGFAAVFGT
jgi:hypothetical protein